MLKHVTLTFYYEKCVLYFSYDDPSTYNALVLTIPDIAEHIESMALLDKNSRRNTILETITERDRSLEEAPKE
jgi:hypothetical protein